MTTPQPLLPVTHSVVSPTALVTTLLPDYAIGPPRACHLLHRGLNDTYLVTTPATRYVLRIYRHQWRTRDDILYEVALLTHLQHAGVAVSRPIARRDGQFTRLLRAPEGERYAVLFTYAPGGPPPWPLPPTYGRLYGQAVAAIHTGLDAFVPAHGRFPLDLDYLIDRPLQSILPFLADRPADAQYLQHLAGRLKARVMLLRGALEHGACHGDCHGGNCHLDAADHLTFFDFDCCGPGWRVFDLATFRWSIALNALDETLWPDFVAGYTSQRRLPDVDRDAVPLFVPIRHFWYLGLHTSHGDEWGYAGLDQHYFDRALTFLRAWEAEHLTDQPAMRADADGGEPAGQNRQPGGTAGEQR